MTLPKLSVIMPAYNAEKFVGLALDSLLAQTDKDFEVIVVDDGSTDATPQIVDAYLAHDRPVVRLIRQDNAGVSNARNVGIQACNAPLIGFLDADDIWAPTKVERHLEVMGRHADIDLGFSSFGYIDQNGAKLIDQSIIQEGRYDHNDLLPRNFIHTSTVIARREALTQVGAFDETLQTFEDFDLWLRIAELRNGNLYALGDQLVEYRRHGTQTTGQWQKMHAGWKRVAERLARDHPKAWGRVQNAAWAHQYEYIASLAYNAGDVAQMRSLMWKAWKAGGVSLFKNQNSSIMVGVALASFLPRPLQIAIGWSFNKSRLLKRRIVGSENSAQTDGGA